MFKGIYQSGDLSGVVKKYFTKTAINVVNTNSKKQTKLVWRNK